MADGENMADSFVSQQIMKVTSRDPGLLGRMGPDSRGTGSPTLVRTGGGQWGSLQQDRTNHTAFPSRRRGSKRRERCWARIRADSVNSENI